MFTATIPQTSVLSNSTSRVSLSCFDEVDEQPGYGPRAGRKAAGTLGGGVVGSLQGVNHLMNPIHGEQPSRKAKLLRITDALSESGRRLLLIRVVKRRTDA